MFNTEFIRIDDNKKLSLNKYKVTVTIYNDFEKTQILRNEIYYLSDDNELNKLKTNYVDKHKLYDITSTEEFNSSEYAWMDGIILQTNNISPDEILKIAEYGSLEAYQASTQEVRDEYLLDIDCRLSMLELGV